MNIFKNKKGVTLLELIVSVGIFSFMMISAVQIFRSVIDGQRSVIASQDTQESVRYTFEKISKDIRMATRDTGGVCTGVAGMTYVTSSGDDLTFLNYRGECVTYYLSSDKIYIDWDITGIGLVTMPITPASVVIKNLNFNVIDSVTRNPQALVTYVMNIEANTDIEKNKKPLRMQSSISLRRYR